ncbi:MAG: FAD-dependent oxidoreductase [Clostridiales bacterium]|nr:FAD-dependent oxidoreductase [Clostridiales bacterium]
MEYHVSIPEESGYDLLVAGGGPAGSAAAICASRLGLKTLLIESCGALGGMGTMGQVCAFDPMADGVRMLTRGFMEELVETLYERNFISPSATPDNWRKAYHCWTPFSSEGLKLVLDDLVTKAGVEVRFFTKVVDSVTQDSQVQGVVTHSIEGFKYIKAKAFIDATGDAVLSKLSGATCIEPGVESKAPMPSTLTALFAGVDWSKPALNTQTPEAVKLIEEEYQNGNFIQLDRLFVGLWQNGAQMGYLNGGHIFNLDSTSVKSLTDGMMLGRKVVKDCERFLKKYSPNCENLELVTTAPLMGVRESRRVVGEYSLSIDDYRSRRQFPDQIGVFNKFVDVHPYSTDLEEYERHMKEKNSDKLKVGESFGLPYGILVPKGFKNLWVAGRCASSDVAVQGSIRVMPPAAVMGQAAGTAAWQSIKTGQPACGIDTSALVKTLRENGAYLPQAELSETMSRA